jgi:hypothetical protein
MQTSTRTMLPANAAGRRAALLLLPFALLACGDGPDPLAGIESHHGLHASAGPAAAAVPIKAQPAKDLLKDLRQATARFHSPTLAAAAGYDVTPCVPAMGYHWLNASLVDPVFDLTQPEVLLYASGPNGQPRLVAVEYIVIDVGQPRPSFGGHAFDIGGTPVPVPHWSLHVWLYADNPDGIFTPFNPTVTCP